MKLNKYLLWLNLFFLQSYLVRFSIGSIPTNLQEVLVLLQIAVFAWMIIKEGRFMKTVKNLSKHWVLIGFVLLAVFSVVAVRMEYNVDFVRTLRFLFTALVLAFIFMETFSADAERKKALSVAGHGAIFFGIFCTLYNLAGLNVAYDYRLQGPLDSAVYLSYYLTPFFIFFLVEFFNDPKKRQNLYHALLLALLIVLTRSMGSIVVSVLVMLLYFFKRSDLKILKSVKVKIALGLFLAFVMGITFYVKILPSYQTTNTSWGERDEIWATSLYLLKEPGNLLFGVGLGQFQQQYFENVDEVLDRKPLDYYILQPHNIFLLFIFQFGLPGLLFLIYCMYRVGKTFLSAHAKDHLTIAVCLMFFYFFIHGLIDTPFFKNDLLILFLLLLELAAGPLKPHIRDKQLH